MNSNLFRAGMKAKKVETSEEKALKKMLELSQRYISLLNQEKFMREEKASRYKKELEDMKKNLEASGITLNFSIQPEEDLGLQKNNIQSEWLHYLAQLGLFGLDKMKPYQLSSGTVAFSKENDMEYMKFLRYKGLPYIEENLLEGLEEPKTEEQKAQKAKLVKQITQTMGMFREADIGPNPNEKIKSMSIYEWKKLVGRVARILLNRQRETFEITGRDDENAREKLEQKLKIENGNETQEKSNAVFKTLKVDFLERYKILDDKSFDEQSKIIDITNAINSVMSEKNNNINETEMLRAFRIEGSINRLLGDYSMNMFSYEEALKVIEAYLATVERCKDNEQALKRTNIGTFVSMAEESKGGRKEFIAKSVNHPSDAAR